MKRKILTAFCLIAASSAQLFGQGFFVDVTGGYGFSMAGQVIDYSSNGNSTGTGSIYTDEIVKGSYGAGMNFGLQTGFMFNDNIGFAIEGNYLLGQKFKSTSKFSSDWGGMPYSSSGEGVSQAKFTRITPSLVVCLPKDKISPYAQLGLMMGFGTIEASYEGSDSDGDSYEYGVRYDQGMAIGMSAVIGVDYKLTDKISLLGSIRSVNMTYAPLHGEITKYKENGVDYLSMMSTYDSEVNFYDELTTNTSSPPDGNSPSKDLKSYMPFSSIGVNIGLRLSL